jgi:hypothetical protein
MSPAVIGRRHVGPERSGGQALAPLTVHNWENSSVDLDANPCVPNSPPLNSWPMNQLRELTVAELIAKLRNDIARNRRIETEARAAAERDERGLTVLEGLVGEQPGVQAGQTTLPAVEPPPASSNGTSPRGEAAVRQVMEKTPDKVWASSGEVHAALEAHGWVSPEAKHPKAGTEAALKRLVKKKLVSRSADGYRLTRMGDTAKD